MSNFRKVISMSAVAILGVTNLLTPLSYANAATWYDALTTGDLKNQGLRFIMPDHDVFLYAITEANKYFVEYSGTTKTSWTMGNVEYTYDTAWDLSPNLYKKTWYTFTEWNRQVNGGGSGYADWATWVVLNWTTTENDVVPIYAQWTPNTYNISYNLNKGDGTSDPVHTGSHPTTATYDTSFTVNVPSRTWYAFSGWTISNMDSEKHTVWWAESYATGASGVMGTSFENLRATSGTVNFLAIWTKNLHTTYKVEHYLEKIEGWYPITPKQTDNLSGVTDTEVTPDIHTYEWFTPDSGVPYSGNIDPDGNKVFTYHYTRNSYNLTINAGRWIESVKWSGSVTAEKSASAGGSTTISFKYDEPVKLSFTPKAWYENAQWSGYSGTASAFNMPASHQEKTAYATPIVYNITYNENWWTNHVDNPAHYTVESGDINLKKPTGINSDFLWWTGTDESAVNPNVTIASGSIWNRSFTAVWKCHTWYHPSSTTITWSNYWNCNADTDTEYTVNHMKQDLNWEYTITWNVVIQTWTTNEQTNATPETYVWFVINQIGEDTIKWDKSTVVDITYKRLSYTWTIVSKTGVVTSSANWAHSSAGWPYKYEDTVTLTATTGAGYTFTSWTVKDASGNTVTVNNSENMNWATFQMPASAVTITPNVTVNTYHITYDLNSWSVSGTNPTTYTVESNNITLINPTRDHSNFDGWSWTNITWLSGTVVIPKWSVWNKSYEAIWSCYTWYHAVGDSCVANTYHVIEGNVDWEWHGAPDDIVFTYGQTETLPVMPSQSWYDFIWWTITWMSGWVNHYIGEITVTGDTYTYSGTSLEVMNLTVEDGGTVTLTARWAPKDDTKYVVNHYIKNVDSNTYTLSWTVNYEWTTDTPVVFADVDKEFFGFTYSGWYVNEGNETRPAWAWVTTGNIDKHGTTVINLYYDRNKHTVYLSGDAHVATLSGAGTYEYGKEVEVSATAKTWYHFKEWKKKTNNTFTTDL